jgi:hypothetical protein
LWSSSQLSDEEEDKPANSKHVQVSERNSKGLTLKATETTNKLSLQGGKEHLQILRQNRGGLALLRNQGRQCGGSHLQSQP